MLHLKVRAFKWRPPFRGRRGRAKTAKILGNPPRDPPRQLPLALWCQNGAVFHKKSVRSVSDWCAAQKKDQASRSGDAPAILADCTTTFTPANQLLSLLFNAPLLHACMEQRPVKNGERQDHPVPNRVGLFSALPTCPFHAAKEGARPPFASQGGPRGAARKSRSILRGLAVHAMYG